MEGNWVLWNILYVATSYFEIYIPKIQLSEQLAEEYGYKSKQTRQLHKLK